MTIYHMPWRVDYAFKGKQGAKNAELFVSRFKGGSFRRSKISERNPSLRKTDYNMSLLANLTFCSYQ
jgi:hypothetical protein